MTLPGQRTLLMRRALPPSLPPGRETIDRMNAVLAVKLPYHGPLPVEDHDVLSTRERAREAVLRWNESHAADPAILDFDGVDVASPSFLDEIHHAWPTARPENMNGDVACAWAMVIERSRTNPALDEDGTAPEASS